MRRKKRRKKRFYYFSIYSLKHDLKVLLHKYRKKCFFAFGIIIALFSIFVIRIFPFSFFTSLIKPNSETVFYANEELIPEEELKEKSKKSSKNTSKESNKKDQLLTLNDFKDPDLISTENVEYQSEAYYKIENQFDFITDKSKFDSLDYVKNNFYIVDNKTDLRESFYNIEKVLSTNLKLKNTDGPKVLIFNTHASEIYKDSKNTSEGVVGLSYELQKALYEKYGIESIVHDKVYDKVNGQSQILGAYQRMTPDVEKVLAENPSIEVCIDIHRDGLPDDVHLVTEINGKDTAQIMFVNGLSKVFDTNNNLVDAPDLPNPNLETNLAFSLDLKLNANEMYPNFARKIYLHAYRYSLFMKPKSILVEVGSQTNTYEESKNAMEPLADILAKTLLP